MVRDHLAACPSCKERVAQLAALRQRLTRMAQVKTTDDFDVVLRARIQMSKKIGRTSWLPELLQERSPLWGYALAGAAVVLLAYAGSFIFTPPKATEISPYSYTKSKVTYPFDRIPPATSALKPLRRENAATVPNTPPTSLASGEQAAQAASDSTVDRETRKHRARQSMKKYVIPVSF